MGKIKQRHNSHARKHSQDSKSKSKKNDVVFDKSIDSQEIELNEDENDVTYCTVLEPNPRIIQRVNKDHVATELKGKKLLSKRKRKQLEKIGEKKRKKSLVWY